MLLKANNTKQNKPQTCADKISKAAGALRVWVSLGRAGCWKVHFLYKMLGDFFELPHFWQKMPLYKMHVIHNLKK